jgi:energy-coupling factor transporter ATP-binding protein EcfA2
MIDNFIPKDKGENQSVTTSDGYIFYLANVATYYFYGGSNILIDPLDSGKLDLISTVLCGPGLALLLTQRKETILHASSFEVNGRAIIVMGNKGYGKSTITAASTLMGHKLISDDVVRISKVNGEYFVHPGSRKINLWPNVAEKLGVSDSYLDPLNGATLKRVYTPPSHSSHPVPLSLLVTLNKGDYRMTSLSLKETLFSLVINRYYSNLQIFSPDITRQLFFELSRLVETLVGKHSSVSMDLPVKFEECLDFSTIYSDLLFLIDN